MSTDRRSQIVAMLMAPILDPSVATMLRRTPALPAG